ISPWGAQTRTEYDPMNRPELIVEAEGTSAERTTVKQYDVVGNLVLVTTGLSSNPNYAHASTTVYTFDLDNRVTVVTEGFGSTVQRTTQTVYDPVGNVRTVIAPNGMQTDFVYDAADERTQIREGVGTSLFRWTDLGYDAVGNIVSRTAGQSANPILN